MSIIVAPLAASEMLRTRTSPLRHLGPRTSSMRIKVGPTVTYSFPEMPAGSRRRIVVAATGKEVQTPRMAQGEKLSAFTVQLRDSHEVILETVREA